MFVEMLKGAVSTKALPLAIVLMDSWYAAMLMAAIEQLGKIYYCPLKTNRLVDDSGGDAPYQRVDQLHWSPAEQQHGKLLKIRGFPRRQKGETVPCYCFYQ